MKTRRTNLLPALIMLTAGAIDCVVSIIGHLSMLEFTRRLLIVLVIFYILGSVVKLVVDINFPQMQDVPAAEEETPSTEEDVTESVTAKEAGEAEEALENIDAQNESE
ncbi:MAG: hypothetical protein NC180_08830 [Muribaculaceae bacterium]|nr:hypothetical protein [Roseburia sp.]MCM1431050.1 hypothetical protein [Muribaculaceae bacterium]MCM1493310.1 hypothetical protein [Muribaculaceae bacterium]